MLAHGTHELLAEVLDEAIDFGGHTQFVLNHFKGLLGDLKVDVCNHPIIRVLHAFFNDSLANRELLKVS